MKNKKQKQRKQNKTKKKKKKKKNGPPKNMDIKKKNFKDEN
jgi:hypothetical protein